MRRALGMMSGTSLDGVDLAVVETDGEAVASFGPRATYPFQDMQRLLLRQAIDAARGLRADQPLPPILVEAEHVITEAHCQAADAFCTVHGGVDVIGLHGQTVVHRPEIGFSLQLGNAQALADFLETPVVYDFRTADLHAGGQGAPLAPLFHAQLAERSDLGQVAVVNIGGIANVTFVGSGPLLAFDTGPGNGLLNDWAEQHGVGAFDLDGHLAAAGTVDSGALDTLMRHPYHAGRPPKSLDRMTLTADAVQPLGLEDGAATLTAYTARSIAEAPALAGRTVERWILTGGGRHNPALVEAIQAEVSQPVLRAEEVGWDGDALEAQLFGWLAVRSERGLPLSVPSTTGVRVPTTGGRRVEPGAA